MKNCSPALFPASLRLWLPVLAAMSLMGGSDARAELFVSFFDGPQVSSYHSLTGAALNPNFISGLSNTRGVTVSGDDLFVVRKTVIDRFNSRTGAVTTASLISGLNNGFHSVVSGTDLYVANKGGNTVGKYTTSGAIQNSSLISGLIGPFFLAVSGNDLYVGNLDNDTIGRYTTAGGVVNAAFITGVNFPCGLAVSNGKLYVANFGSNEIRVFDAQTGAVINALFVSGLDGPGPIAIYKNRLYVGNYTGGYVGVYDATTGATINATFISGTPLIEGLAIHPVANPTVRLTGPKTIRVTQSVARLKGLGTDAERVVVKVGSGPFRPAKGTSSWTFRVAKLKPGLNRVKIQAINSEGVKSITTTVKIVRSGS